MLALQEACCIFKVELTSLLCRCQQTLLKKESAFSNEKKVPFETTTKVTETAVQDILEVQKPNEKLPTTDTSSTVQNKDTSLASVKDNKVVEESKTVSLKNDEAVKPAVKKQASSKWKYAIAASSGFSSCADSTMAAIQSAKLARFHQLVANPELNGAFQ